VKLWELTNAKREMEIWLGTKKLRFPMEMKYQNYRWDSEQRNSPTEKGNRDFVGDGKL